MYCRSVDWVWRYETKIILNSHLIIPDFPHDIKIRLAPLKSFFCCVLTLQNFCPVGKTYITYIHIMFFYNAKLICFWHMYYTNLSNYIQSLETTLLTRTYFCAGFFKSLNRVFFVWLQSFERKLIEIRGLRISFFYRKLCEQ